MKTFLFNKSYVTCLLQIKSTITFIITGQLWFYDKTYSPQKVQFEQSLQNQEDLQYIHRPQSCILSTLFPERYPCQPVVLKTDQEIDA